jgi:hypothetical protein
MIAQWHMRTVAKRSEPNQFVQANRHFPRISFSLLNVSRMKKFSKASYVLFVFILCTSGIIRHDKSIHTYKEIGSRKAFNAVGRYATLKDTASYAAGVLIAPQWVLTAAHFVEDSSVWLFGNQYYKTRSIIKHPKLKANATEAQWNGWDMALVELDRPVSGITPAIRYRGHGEFKNIITKIGYGYAGDGRSGLSIPRIQERLGGNNTIDAIGGTFEGRAFSQNVMVCDFDSPETTEYNHFGDTQPLEYEIGGSKGDSGGGIFMEVNGRQVLVGIVSGGLNRQLKYGSVMALARVSTANEWIDAVLAEKKSGSKTQRTDQRVKENTRHEVLKKSGHLQLSGPALVTAFHF